MKNLLLAFLLISLSACAGAKLVRDLAPATLDVGHKRVETEICGSWAVGENGCVFDDGKLNGELKIYGVLRGSVTVIGQGCLVDKTFQYEWNPKDPWIHLPLKDLIGEKLDSDCVLTIYQRLDYPNQQEAPFPIRGIYGTVSLGVCPAGALCSFKGEQSRVGWPPEPLVFDAVGGQYTLRGCGREIVPPTDFNAPLKLKLEELWPSGFPSQKSGCLFILGVRGSDGSRHKIYRKVSLFSEETIRLSEPVLTIDGDKIKFKGDRAVSLSIVGEKVHNSASGKFEPGSSGNVLRFYTVQGRSLVVFVRDGLIKWVQ
jgi:hypothetical protein